MRLWLAALLALFYGCSFSYSYGRQTNSALASAERKVRHVQSNGAASHADTTPTEFTEQEINAYVAAGNLELPAGVKSVIFREQPGMVTATAQVDFDQLKAGKGSSNPLLSIFSGEHTVVGAAHASGSDGQGTVHVDSVALDGVEVPRFALELFAERYLAPRYPGIGLDSRFRLPDRIDTVVVGLHKVTVIQK